MVIKRMLPIIVGLLVLLVVAGCFTEFGGISEPEGRRPLPSPAPKPGPGQKVFRLAEGLTAGYPATIGDIEFARLVEERSHGRIKIIVYYGAKLGDERSVIEQIQFGGVDFARVNAAPLSEFHRPLILLSLPYLFRDSNHLWQVLYGPIGQELLTGLATKNMVGLTYYTSAARSFYTKRPVRSLADMRGLRIRVQQSELYMDLVRALGAEPVPIAFGDVYNSLLLNQVDGAENNWASFFEVKHYRLVKNYTVDTHTRTPEVLLVNRSVFQQLSPADRALILQAARDSVKPQWKASAAKEASSEAEVRKRGVKVIELSEAVKEQFQRASERLYDKYGREYRGLIERIRKTK